MTAKWTKLADEAGLTKHGRITGLTIHAVACGRNADDDVTLCPMDRVPARIAEIARGPSAQTRTVRADRAFMARALSVDATTATALIVRAVIGRWVHMRGNADPACRHEAAALELAEDHLGQLGHATGRAARSNRNQVAPAHIVAPISHSGPHDVVAKAMAQYLRQVGGRHVVFAGTSPMSAT